MAKTSTQDITKTGPQSWRDLQRQNNADYQAAEQGSELAKRWNTQPTFVRPSQMVYEGPEHSPLQQQGTGDYWGKSMWDEPNATEDEWSVGGLGDVRAKNEPWIAKIGAGLTKGAVLAGTTFANGTLGLLTGIGTAATEGRWSGLWDNAVTNGLQDINRSIEEVLPNYRTQQEQEGPWYGNIFGGDGAWANWWGDTFLKNIGFTVGAFYSGGMFNKVLQGAKMLKSGVGAAVAGSVYSAVGEGMIEANNTAYDLGKLENEKLDDAYRQRYDEIAGNPYSSEADKQRQIQELNNAYTSQQEDIANRTRQAGDIDLLGNIALLSLDNFGILGRMYARGFRNAERVAMNNFGTQAGRGDLGITSRIRRAGENLYDEFTYDKRGVGNAIANGLLKPAAVEGNEEMAQQFISNLAGNVRISDSPDAYYEALTDPDAQQKTMDVSKAITKAFADSYGDGSQWEQFAVGALTGVMGMPTFGAMARTASEANEGVNIGPVGLQGGILGQLKQNRYLNQKGEETVGRMNNFINKLRDKQTYLAGSQHFSDVMDGWAKDRNQFEYKNAEDNDMAMAIQSFAQAGQMETLNNLIDLGFDNLTDKDLDTIAKTTTRDNADGSKNQDGWKLADGTYMSENEYGRALMREELQEKKRDMKKQIGDYMDSLDKVRAIGQGMLNESQVNELAWLDWKVGRFQDRLKSIMDRNGARFGDVGKSVQRMIDDLLEERKNLTDDMVEKDEETGKERHLLKENSDMLENYRIIKRVFDALSTGNTEGLVVKDGKGQVKGVIDMVKVLEKLKDEGFYGIYGNDSGLSYTDYKKAIDDAEDAYKLRDAIGTFNDRLKDFVEDPRKVVSNRQRIDKKKKKENDAKESIERTDRISSRKVSEMVNDEVNFPDEDLDAVIDAMPSNEEMNESARKAFETKKVRNTGKKARAKLEDMRDQAANDEERAEIDDALNLLDKGLEVSESADELLDINREAYVDPENVATQGEIDQIARLQEGGEEILERRSAKARAVLNMVFAKIIKDEDEAKKMPRNGKEKSSGNDDVKYGWGAGADTNGQADTSAEPNQKTPEINQGHQAAPGGNMPGSDRQTGQRSKREQDIDRFLEGLPEDYRGNQTLRDTIGRMLDTVDMLIAQGFAKDMPTLGRLMKQQVDYNRLIEGINDLETRVWNYVNQAGPGANMPSPEGNQNNQTNQANQPNQANQANQGQNGRQGTQGAQGVQGEMPKGEENESGQTPQTDDGELKQSAIERGQREDAEWTRNSDQHGLKISTTEFGMHDGYDSLGRYYRPRPYWETAVIWNRAYEKTRNGEPLTEEEQMVRGRYKWNKFPYSDVEIQYMKAVWEYLKEKGAYDAINNGIVKVGEPVFFKIDNELNRKAGMEVVLMTLNDGTVIGDLSNRTESGKKVIREWEKAGKPDNFESEESVIVRQMMMGRMEYTPVEERVKLNSMDLAKRGNGGLKIGVWNGVEMILPDGVEKDTVTPPLRARRWQPFVLVPTRGRTEWVCVPFTMRKYDGARDESTIGKTIVDEVKAALPKVKEAAEAEYGNDADKKTRAITKACVTVKSALVRYLSLSRDNLYVFWNEKDNGVDVEYTPQGSTQTRRLKGLKIDGDEQVSETANKILDFFVGTPFRVNEGLIRQLDKKTMEQTGATKSGAEYIEMIGDIARTNLPLNTASTKIDWFVTNAIGQNSWNSNPGDPNRVPNPNQRGQRKEVKFSILVGDRNREVFVDTKTYDVNYTADELNKSDKSPKPLTNTQKNLARALAYCRMQGQTENRMYMTQWGEVNPETHEFKEQKKKGTQPITKADIDRAEQSNQGQTGQNGPTGQQAAPGSIMPSPAGQQGQQNLTIDLSRERAEKLISEAMYELGNERVAEELIPRYRGMSRDELYERFNNIKFEYEQTPYKEKKQALEYEMGGIAMAILGLTDEGKETLKEILLDNYIDERGVKAVMDALGSQNNQGQPRQERQERQERTYTEEEANRIADQNGWSRGRKSNWSKLTLEQKNEILNMKDGNVAMQRINSQGAPQGSVRKAFGLNRVADRREGYKIWNRKKELDWMERTLPQLSRGERVMIVDGLIKIGGNDEAYGRFENGVITLSDRAAEGTLYHEAFHAVTEVLMTQDEREALLDAAREKWGDKGEVALEEMLAESFRRYVQWEEKPVVGQVVRLWRTLKRIVEGLVGKEPVIRGMFRRIQEGGFADRPLAGVRERIEMNERAKEYEKRIEKWGKEKWNYDNLSEERKDILYGKGISMIEYEQLSPIEKEMVFRCG